ncbi:VWA domain containing protein [Asbolus verrucosus]|uniref:VWA domain containing protein n=1 Tax=Asbolus verrucosus TaxID=1661398 RepID=A0A482VCD1_ASBVE|nr:VWA domain containing protein [Asbolus verrucosus]
MTTIWTLRRIPDKNQQRHFAEHLGSNKETGLAGQFVVQYDVERDPQGGEVLMRDGYFVHFFSPSELQPLSKHVVFVLDHSGSMIGREIEQLTEAMQNILPELGDNDFFNIIRFSDNALVWDPNKNIFTKVFTNGEYGHLEPELRELGLPGGVKATKENIEKAKEIVKDHGDMGMTNIIAGLEIGLFLIKRTQEKFPNKYQPMIIFLTDGLPNVGMDSGDLIIDTVTKLNSGPNRASIFSLSFGSSADKSFLRKLSSQNLGFSRHIYGAADASLQLQDFYRKISSPLLSNVTFKYVDGVTDVTKSYHPILFNGSELVVAGRTKSFSSYPITANRNLMSAHSAFSLSGLDYDAGSNIPKWLEDIRNNNENITTPQGVFKLGKKGDVILRPQCLKTPSNGTGECTILFDCPQVFNLLTNITVYLQYFCPLNEYAGVCCPSSPVP